MSKATKRRLTARQLIQKFPRLRRNKNCLINIACPECGNRDQFRIEMKSVFTLRDDGTVRGRIKTSHQRSNQNQPV